MSQLAYVETFLRQLSLRLHEGATYHTLARELVGSLLVEQACAGAVVDTLHACPASAGQSCSESEERGGCDHCQVNSGDFVVPIASVGPFGWLAEAAGDLLLTQCHGCGHRATCIAGHINDPAGCEEIEPPPFVAVRSELLVDGKPWVECLLVSAKCRQCGGSGLGREADAGAAHGYPCHPCSGTGARTDVRAIADRYQPDQPWRDEDTPLKARFRVRVS